MRNSSTRRLGAVTLMTLLAMLVGFATPAVAGAKGSDQADRSDRPSVSGSTDDDSAVDANGDADNAHPSGKDRHEDKGTQGYSTSTPDQNGHGPERDFEGTDKPFVAGDGAGGVDKADQDGNNGCGNDDDFEDDNEGWCGGKPKRSTTPPPGVDDEDEVKCTGTMPSGSHGDEKCDHDDECTGTMPTTGSHADDECDHDDDTDVLGEDTTKCPKAGETLPSGTEMPAGCTTTTPTDTVTSETLATGAVLGTELQNAPAGEEARVLGIQLERTTPAAVAGGAATAPAGTQVLGVALARTGLSFTILALAIALGLLAVGFALKRAGRTTSDL
jgi:hypothetical protein